MTLPQRPPPSVSLPGLAHARQWVAELSLDLERRGPKTLLLRSEHRGPLRVQRPFYPEAQDCCHVYLLHPPGGMVLGDRLQITIRVGQGANALITTPSAGKFYDTRSASEIQRQEVHLLCADMSCLEWLPQETIIFSGANARLHTRLELRGDSKACLWDIVCLGRPAAGEVFDRGRCEQILEISRDGRLLLMERNRFIAGHESMNASWGLRSAPVAGTFLATLKPSRDRVDALVEELAALAPPPEHEWGLTQKGEIFLARYVGYSTRLCRLGFEYIWRQLRPDLTGAPALAPRIWNT